MKNKITSFAFAGLIGLNIFKPGVGLDRDSSPVASSKPGILERIETRIQNSRGLRAWLSNVKVTAISASTITVDDNGTNVTVNILSNTQLRRKFWGKSNLAEISIGDSVQVIGKWTDNTKTSVNAVLIRDTSIQKRNGVFFGTVKSISGNTFVITTIHRGDETVTVDSTTKIVDRKEGVLTQTDIKVGDKIRVKGMWDSAAKTITEVKQIKDFSLPLKPISTPL